MIVLAKSNKNKHSIDYGATLEGHTESVASCYAEIFGTFNNYSDFLYQWLRFFNVDESCKDIFYNTGLLSCILHDLGKSNSEFQSALQMQIKQLIRHEHLSSLMVFDDAVKENIINVGNIDYDILLVSIMGHHLKSKRSDVAEQRNFDRDSFIVHKEGIEDINKIFIKYFKKPKLFDTDSIHCLWSFVEKEEHFCFDNLSVKMKKYIHLFEKKIRNNREKINILNSIRSALIICDSSGSGIVRENYNIKDWISDQSVFKKDNITKEYIYENIIQKRIEKINNFKWNYLQNEADNVGDRVLLMSGCGSGKTLFAYRWFAAVCNRRNIKNLIFCYPTRGTANEGFIDYGSLSPEDDAALIHSSSQYELEDMFENSIFNKDFSVEKRMFALGYWNKKIITSTIDQFMGFTQHVYKSLCMLPILVNSAIVIDEFHSFDKSLFSSLKKFAENFDIPILCMSASVNKNRIEDLKNIGFSIFPEDDKSIDCVDDDSKILRYNLDRSKSYEELQKIAIEENKKGKSILWVTNNVRRCQKISKKLNATCYHSRFKLDDRKRIHRYVVDSFRNKKPIIVTTQVCEMSLDIDADILITEECPTEYLIQRMGRCNRKRNTKSIGKVFVYKPEDKNIFLPYSGEDFIGMEEFLKELDGREFSQHDLSVLLDKYGKSENELYRYASFFDGCVWASAREESLRDGNGFMISCILSEDIDEYLNLKKNRKPTDGLFVPIPIYCSTKNKKIGKYPRVSDESKYSFYSKELGFVEREEKI